MRRAKAWLLLALCVFLAMALNGFAVGSLGLSRATPDLGLVLIVGVDSELSRGRALVLVLLVALSRIALGTDAPLAVLVGYSGVHLALSELRRTFDVDRPLGKALAAGLAGLALPAYVSLVRALASPAELEPALVFAPAQALATALAVLLLAPLAGRVFFVRALARKPA